MNKLERVKAEIERRMDELYSNLPDGNDVVNGRFTAQEANITGKYTTLESILSFINSMQEEPVSIWHDGCEIPKSETNILMIRKEEKDSNYPPIAGCFHGTNSRLDGRNWGYYNGFCYNEIEPPVKWVYIDDIK